METWLAETGGAASMAAAPTILVALGATMSSASWLGGAYEGGSSRDDAAGASGPGLSLGGTTAVFASPDGTVREPASGAFDVTVAPGQSIQAAVDRCPRDGCVLLLPGTHAGPLVLAARKEVHVFGRGRAILRTAAGEVIVSAASMATIDGLIVRTGAHTEGDGHYGILITAGKLRVQACDVSSQSRSGICVQGPTADPFIVGCRLHHGARAGIALCDGCQGTVKDCM